MSEKLIGFEIKNKENFQLRAWQYPLFAPDCIGLVIVGFAAEKVVSSGFIAK